MSTLSPADDFQLLQSSTKSGAAEDALFSRQVKAVREWWNIPRYDGVKRPYSAEDVVSKRGTLQQQYPSSLMSQKLYRLLEEREAQGKPVHTSM